VSSRYLDFDRADWARLRAATPLTLVEADLSELQGINERVSIAEVEAIVEPGQLDPDAVVTPGIYVTHLLKGAYFEKRIERRTVRQLQPV